MPRTSLTTNLLGLPSWTLVQTAAASSTTTSLTVTLGSAPSASSMILVAIIQNQSASDVGVLTCKAHTTSMTQDATLDPGSGEGQNLYLFRISGVTTTDIVVANIVSSIARVVVMEWSGQAASPVDTGSTNFAVSTTLTTGSFTPTTSNSLNILVASSNGAAFSSPPAGWTQVDGTGPSPNRGDVRYFVQLAAAALNPSETTSSLWTALGQSYKHS